jgi:tetratricopeptide (TPR) repeat protein
MLMMKGDYASSEGYLKPALSICRQVGDQPGEHYVLYSLALLSDNQGRYLAAKAYWDQALHLNLAEDGSVIVSGDFLGLALVAARLGDYKRARDYAEQALPVLFHPEFALWGLSFLGLFSYHAGDDKAAWEYCRRARHGLQNPGNSHIQAYALTVLGHALTGLGDLDVGHRLLQEWTARLDDEELRRSFLENVPAHREIVALWQEAS